MDLSALRLGLDGMSLLLLLLVGALLLVCLWLWARLRAAQGRWSRASRARNRRAQGGEAAAEALLEAHGFTVVERQAVVEAAMWVDGEERRYTVRFDLLVHKGGQNYVAEVKTGERAPDPTHPPTRRQLLEYALLMPDHGVLLIDMEDGAIVEVDFG